MSKNKNNKPENKNAGQEKNKTKNVKKEVIQHKKQEILKQNIVLKDIWEANNDKDGTRPVLKNLLLTNTNDSMNLKKNILDIIETAREKILICSFLFNDNDIADALVNKANDGIKIYIITASEAILNKSQNEDFSRHNEHVRLLKKFAHRNIIVRMGDIHAKFIVADPDGSRLSAIISTSNFNKEPLERNGEAGIKLNYQAGIDLANLFVKTFWEKTKSELDIDGKELGRGDNIRKQTNIYLQNTNILCTFDNEINSIKDTCLKYLTSAEKRILLTSYNYNYKSMEDILEEKAKSGVKIGIIGREWRIIKSNLFKALKDYENVSFYINEDIHAKILISDDTAALLTANYETLGMDEGVETGCSIDISDAVNLWDYYKNKSEYSYQKEKEYKHGDKVFGYNNEKRTEEITVRNKKHDAGVFKLGQKPDMDKIKKQYPNAPEIEVNWIEEEVKIIEIPVNHDDKQKENNKETKDK